MHNHQTQKIRAAAMLGFISLCSVMPFNLRAEDTVNLSGAPTIIDSGTLLINGQKISLWGINSLASDQMCWEGSMAWSCGKEATLALRHFVHGHTVKCELMPQEEKTTTTQKARCIRETTLRKKDLAKFLTQKGLATASDNAYSSAEKNANIFKRGIWSGKFQTAKDWNNGIEQYVNQ